MRAWKRANPDKVRAYAKKYSQTDSYRSYQSEWKKRERRRNPEKARAKSRAKQARHRDAYNAAKRGGGAGLTPAQIEAMISAVDGRCEICGKPMSRVNVDHCHTTGRVRGLLCTGCNTFLGHIEKRGHLVDAIVRYIAKGNRK